MVKDLASQELAEKALGVNRPKATPRKVAKKSAVSRRRVLGKSEAIGTPPSEQQPCFVGT